jgi:outer membrane receptor for ferrienterochelin and colicin
MRKILLFISILSILASHFTLAGTTGKLTGKVTDAKTNESLPFVNITLMGTSLGAATDIDGNYVILNIPPGNYKVRAQSVGYQPVIMENISISIDLTTKLDFSLNSSMIELQAIVVEGRQDQVKKDVTSSQSLVSAEQINSLPVAEFDDVLRLQTGVSVDADGGFHIRGGRSTEIAYWVNGISITDPYDNSRGVDIDNSSIQELQVISGTFNAEYGNAMSGIVNTVTKEGGREYHGSVNIYSSDYVSNFTSYFTDINHYNPVTNYNFQGNLSGNIPYTDNMITFFVNGRYVYDEGYLYGLDKFNTNGTPADGHPVPMNWSKRTLAQGNIAYQFIQGVKINTEFLFSKDNYQDYDHTFKWEPGGNPFKFAKSYDGTLSLNHILSSKTFYTIRANYFFKDFNQYLFANPSDPGYMHPDSLITVGYAFHDKGTDLHRFFRETKSTTVKLDFSSQVTENHLVQFGAEGKTHNLGFDDYNLEPLQLNGSPVVPFVPSIPGVSSINRNFYTANPLEFSGYIQDKIEYKDVIINFGLRFDYFNSRGNVLVDPQDPNIYLPLRTELQNLTIPQLVPYFYKKATPKQQFSPRFGIAYPISANGVIHFSYGHFLQVPTFQYLFDGSTYKVSESGSYGPFGNPDLQPQRTIMYELGFRQQFMDEFVIDATGFYRDIREWITASAAISNITGATYSIYTNKDYSNVRGITINLSKRFSNHYSIDLNYTYQVAEGSNSNPNDEYNAILNNQAPVIFLSPLNWDQRHNLNLNILVGDNDWNVSLLFKYGTGLPYTPSITQATADRGLSTGFYPNILNRPTQFDVDLYANKSFDLMGFRLTAYLKVFNLFDARNVVNVFTDTGAPDYTTQTQNVGYDPARPNTVAEYIKYPTNYAAPRLVQTGIEFSF